MGKNTARSSSSPAKTMCYDVLVRCNITTRVNCANLFLPSTDAKLNVLKALLWLHALYIWLWPFKQWYANMPPCGRTPLGMPGRVAEERSTRKWIQWSRTSWANSVCQFQEIPGAWAPGTSPSRHPSAAQGDGDASAMGTKVWHSVATLSFPQCQDGMAIGCPHPDFSEFSNSWGSSTVWSHPDPKPTGYPTPDRARQVASFRRISWGRLAAKQRWQLKLELRFLKMIENDTDSKLRFSRSCWNCQARSKFYSTCTWKQSGWGTIYPPKGTNIDETRISILQTQHNIASLIFLTSSSQVGM